MNNNNPSGGGWGPAAMAERLNLLPQNLDHQLMLRSLFAAHFTLTGLVLLSSWPPTAFVFYNSFLLAGLLWTAGAVNPLDVSLQKCIFIESVAVVFDVVLFLHFYPQSSKTGMDLFAFIAAALQTLGRFGGIYILRRIRKERLASGGGGGGVYENVTGSTHSHPTGPPMMTTAPAPMPNYGYNNDAPKTLGGGFPDFSAGRRLM